MRSAPLLALLVFVLVSESLAVYHNGRTLTRTQNIRNIVVDPVSKQIGRLSLQIDKYFPKVEAGTPALGTSEYPVDVQKAYNKFVAATTSSTIKRKVFIRFMASKTDLPKNDPTNGRVSIKMTDFIGEEGIRKYTDAIKEEANSKNYRKAIFLEACKYNTGTNWKLLKGKPVVIFIGGPSASGKTVAAKGIINTMIDSPHWKPPANADGPKGNFVCFIDGGIEREFSQMRSLIIQFAIKQGYSDIVDLHGKTKLNIKEKLRDAVVLHRINALLPLTYSNPADFMLFKTFSKYSQVMARVKGSKVPEEGSEDEVIDDPDFRDNVYFQGSLRATYQKKEELATEISIGKDAKAPCESKVYEPEHFGTGQTQSHFAYLVYKGFLNHNRVMTVRNDYSFYEFVGDQLVPANRETSDLSNIRGLTKRQYNKYIETYKDNQNIGSLDQFKKTPEFVELMTPVVFTEELETNQARIKKSIREKYSNFKDLLGVLKIFLPTLRDLQAAFSVLEGVRLA